jgi:nicotinamidase/pyrazinamidase
MKAFFDIDTQIDFMFPAGALYVPGAERLLPAIARLNAYAAKNGIPQISTLCAHPENAAEFSEWPPHCIVGTIGQQKPAVTLQPGQIVIEKNATDMFSNPTLVPLLDRLEIDDCYVYGVVLEVCVRHAVLGLLKTGRKVKLISDATIHVDAEAGRAALEQFGAVGDFGFTSVNESDI